MDFKTPATPFRKVNLRDIPELAWSNDGLRGFGTEISEALGRDPYSTDLISRHPFDVEMLRVPPGATPYRYHSHSAQWEYYQVVSGTGIARHAGGRTPIEAGDAFLFKPGEAHQLINDSDADLVMIVVADNPIGESYHYPDEDSWVVNSPRSHYVVVDPQRPDERR